MPSTMKKLGIIQFFSWFAFFVMWSLATPALTEHVFKAPSPIMDQYNMQIEEEAYQFELDNKKYQDAADLVGSYMGTYGLSSMAFALLLTLYTSKRRINRKMTHMISLLLGGSGFIIMRFIDNPNWLILSFMLIGVSWGSILSMPYAMLSSSIDENKMGLYMGLFNMFIVFPQIIAALGGANFLSNLLGDDSINAMTLAGICLIVAGLSNNLITDKSVISYAND